MVGTSCVIGISSFLYSDFWKLDGFQDFYGIKQGLTWTIMISVLVRTLYCNDFRSRANFNSMTDLPSNESENHHTIPSHQIKSNNNVIE